MHQWPVSLSKENCLLMALRPEDGIGVWTCRFFHSTISIPSVLFSPMHEDAAARSAQRVLSSGSHTGVDIWPVAQSNWSQEVGIQWQKHHPQMMKAWAECCRNPRGAGQTAGLMREGPIARPSWKTSKIPVAHCPVGQDRGPICIYEGPFPSCICQGLLPLKS